MRYLIHIVCFCLSLVSFGQSDEFKACIDTHLKQTVPTISIDSLASHYNDFTILDARTVQEYEVSHLANATHVGYQSFKLKDAIKRISKSKPVVIYCSIGFRSEKIGERLQKKGYTVYNLYGGIFQWKNDGQEVINLDGQPTEKVHCYDAEWGQWLTNGIKIYE